MRIKEPENCAICTEEFVAPCPVTLLECNENHFYHTECIDSWIAHNKKSGKAPSCPKCRKPVNEPGVKKLQFKGLDAPPQIPDHEMTEAQRAVHKEQELADIFGGPAVAAPGAYGATDLPAGGAPQAYAPDGDGIGQMGVAGPDAAAYDGPTGIN